MPVWLDKYRGCEVEILYLTDNNVYRDRGRLTDLGDGWVEIVKPNSETFLVPMTAIRLMKLFSQPADAAGRLLRPASQPQQKPVEQEPIDAESRGSCP